MNSAYLEKRMQRLKAKKEGLTKKALESHSADEVREINAELAEINDEISDIQSELDEESRSANAVKVNANIVGNTVGSFKKDEKRDSDPYATMEYRTAFKDFVQKGVAIPASLTARADTTNVGITTVSDLGAIVPTTVMNEFISQVQKVYGQIYAKVRKISVQGGVKFPVSDLKANFKWITETTVSPNQRAGEIKDYIEFSYNIGEIRLAQSLLSSIVTLSAFESEVTRIMVEAYVEAMDKGIFWGTGAGQMLGVFNDPRVTNVVEFTAAEFADWKAWRKKLFAVIPLSLRGRGEFVFPASTVESNLLTMEDGIGRPLFREATDLTLGDTGVTGRFFGREITLVEPDVIPDFETANAGDVIGLFWNPQDYAINTQLQFGIKRYFDDDTNQWINKGLTVVDGKMLDTKSCYILKKKG